MYVPEGNYVIQDSLTWEREFVPFWAEMWHEVEDEMQLVPPPRPDFGDSLIVYVSHGTTGCYERGGNVDSISVAGSTATIHLGEIYQNNPACAAEVPRSDIVRVARKDLPDDVTFEFVPAAAGYEIEPSQWYPLAIGNAWSYRYAERVDRVVEREAVGDLEWYRLQSYDCGGQRCDADSTFWLAWTLDAFLLYADDARARVDTVLHPVARSPFSVNQALDTLALYRDGTREHRLVEARIYFRQDEPFYGRLSLHLTTLDTFEYLASYVLGFGPEDGVGAIIDGIRIGDTSLLELVLDTEHPRPPNASFTLRVYPHPASTDAVISIEGAAPGHATIETFDLLGRRRARQTRHVDDNVSWRMDLGEFDLQNPGIYLLRVIDASGRVATRSFVVVR